jgi:hypothetical protein
VLDHEYVTRSCSPNCLQHAKPESSATNDRDGGAHFQLGSPYRVDRDGKRFDQPSIPIRESGWQKVAARRGHCREFSKAAAAASIDSHPG